MSAPVWFVIRSGSLAGTAHLKGWMLSAIRCVESGTESGWLAYGICPRCHAMVQTDDRHPYGDQQWAHEQWHAQTDWPIPAGVLAKTGGAS